MRKSLLILAWGVALIASNSGCIVVPLGDLFRGAPLGEYVLSEGAGFFSKEKIAILDLDGVITADESTSLLSSRENVVSELKARLDLARADPQVKAVVIRISSPGGEVTACDVLHHEVKKFKEATKVPVVACIVDQGTSGAYYVASAADVIVTHPTAMVGSIGVILQSFDLSELIKKIGVSVAPVKSSPQKDLNSLFRPMTSEERQILQKLVDDMYGRFVDVVAEARPQLTREEVLRLADGRVISGTEAVQLKLVDRVGYMSDALALAGEKGGVESPTIVRYTRAARSGANIYTRTALDEPASAEIRLSLSPDRALSPRLYYLWQPGI